MTSFSLDRASARGRLEYSGGAAGEQRTCACVVRHMGGIDKVGTLGGVGPTSHDNLTGVLVRGRGRDRTGKIRGAESMRHLELIADGPLQLLVLDEKLTGGTQRVSSP